MKYEVLSRIKYKGKYIPKGETVNMSAEDAEKLGKKILKPAEVAPAEVGKEKK